MRWAPRQKVNEPGKHYFWEDGYRGPRVILRLVRTHLFGSLSPEAISLGGAGRDYTSLETALGSSPAPRLPPAFVEHLLSARAPCYWVH